MALTNKQKFNKKHGQPINQANSISKIAKLSGITYKAAKDIIKKGEAAFYNNRGAVRPQVKSATQWGIARLYAAVNRGTGAAKVDKKEIARGKKNFKNKRK
jgi:hypothetical protein